MSTESYWPLPVHPDGRKPRISDGWHTERDVAALRATRVHLGADVMYRRPARGKPNLPEQSAWFEVPNGTPCMAIRSGEVLVSEVVRRGGYVLIDHGGGMATQYMHLATLAIKAGDVVRAGQQIGVVGYDLAGYKLNHLHLQLREGFKTVKASGDRINPWPLLKTCKFLDRPLREDRAPCCSCPCCIVVPPDGGG